MFTGASGIWPMAKCIALSRPLVGSQGMGRGMTPSSSSFCRVEQSRNEKWNEPTVQ